MRLDLQQLQQRLFQAAGEGKEGGGSSGGEEQAALQAKLEAAREQLRKAQVCTSQDEMKPLLLGLHTHAALGRVLTRSQMFSAMSSKQHTRTQQRSRSGSTCASHLPSQQTGIPSACLLPSPMRDLAARSRSCPDCPSPRRT